MTQAFSRTLLLALTFGHALPYSLMSVSHNDRQSFSLRSGRLWDAPPSGGRWDRPELHRALQHLREGDVLVVWKLDRLSRSLKDLLHIMGRVREAGAGFRSLTEAVDTTTAAGRMMMQMLGSFAEFERSMVRERTRAGLAAARDRGVKVGRPAKLKTRINSKRLFAAFATDPRLPRTRPGWSACIAPVSRACLRVGKKCKLTDVNVLPIAALR